MLRPAVLFLAVGTMFPRLSAQVNELGLTGGVTYYLGDLNPTKHYPGHGATRFGGGVVFRHNISDRYALRFQGLFGKLQAYDSDSPDSLQQLRNLHFEAKLFEGSLLWEINFFPYRGTGKLQKNWTPFVFMGLGYFHASPKAELKGTWYELQPLGTEGQGSSAGGDPYKVDQICIPFGAGLKVNFGRIDLQLEWGLRRTTTDYIDDVSGTYVDNDLLDLENGPLAAQIADPSVLRETGFNTDRARGDANTRDWYQYTGLSLTLLLSKFTDCDAQYDWMKKRR